MKLLQRSAVLLLVFPLLLHGRASLEDVHNRELHGPSIRHLHDKMAKEARTGVGDLTEDDAAILFMRYQREFNRSLASGAYSHQTMTMAYESFRDATKRLAKLVTDPNGPHARGVELALNEISDISEDDWEAMVESGRRRLVMPFAPPQRRQDRAFVQGQLDWRDKGLLASHVLSLDNRSAPLDHSSLLLSGTVDAKAVSLDHLFIRDRGGDRSALPRGGFGHLARQIPALAEALGAGPPSQRDVSAWGRKHDEGGLGFREGVLELSSTLSDWAGYAPFRESANFVARDRPLIPPDLFPSTLSFQLPLRLVFVFVCPPPLTSPR